MVKAVRSNKSAAFQLKVTLKYVAPPIWRRVLVPSDILLGELHRVLHEVMGWTGSHLHSFVVGGRTFGDPRADVHRMLNFEDERKVKLDSLMEAAQALQYQV